MTEKVQGIPLVPEPSREVLGPRQQVDYAAQRRSWLEWCLLSGKNPKKQTGYSKSTIENRASRVDQFFRWDWSENGGDLTTEEIGHIDGPNSQGGFKYSTVVDHEDGDSYLKHLAFSDYSQMHKANSMKALKTYFKWRHHEHGEDEWDPEYTFSTPNRQASTKDRLNREERRLIREAALEYGSIPHYNSVTPEERDRWKTHLAQRFEIPKEQVGLDHWERANGWKYPSLVWASLDAGLRPCEVQEASVNWLDLDNKRLVIPMEHDVKVNREAERRQWTPVLTDRTVEGLRRWVEQRKAISKYDDSDKLWLTKYGNPYGDASDLSDLMTELCKIADIDLTNRELTWYSIRGGTTTEIVSESDLSTAAEQVRHRDIRTTRRYDQAPEGRRRDTLERLG